MKKINGTTTSYKSHSHIILYNQLKLEKIIENRDKNYLPESAKDASQLPLSEGLLPCLLHTSIFLLWCLFKENLLFTGLFLSFVLVVIFYEIILTGSAVYEILMTHAQAPMEEHILLKIVRTCHVIKKEFLFL